MNVLVIGGGIGGLTTALSMHQAGFEVTVFEAVREIGALGVGINLQPNAVRELTELGLGEELARTGIPTSTLAYYNKHGQRIWSEPRGREAGYRWPQYSIHRGELLMILVRAVRERLGEASIRCGHQLASFEQDANGVTAHFIDRRSGAQVGTARGDMLIGADGIHSAVRAQLYPNEGEPRFCGQMMWRAAVESTPYLDGCTHAITGHRDQKFLVYPMSAGARQRGRSLINWIAELTVPGPTPRADWNKQVAKEVFANAFAKWRFPWLDVPALIDATEAVFEFPKVDRDPVAQWSFGRVTLIGDAAHAMLPIGSQAGSQAVVDPRYLARALLTEPRPEAALVRYEAERLPAMNEITLRIRGLGQEIVMEMAEERAPDGFERIEEVIPNEEMARLSAEFKLVAGLDRDYVNSRESLLHMPK
ncbi:MAG: flavin-dependent oxidoreductase [Burkholderiales bacterium]